MGSGNRDQWDIYKDIFQRNFDQAKVYVGGVIEYGKFLVQTLFALNGLGVGAIQTLRFVLEENRLPSLKAAAPQISFIFIFGAISAIISAYLAYWNFFILTNEQFSKWNNEWKNFSENKKDEFSESSLKLIFLVAAHIVGVISLVAFCFGCFRLYAVIQ